MYPQEKQVCSLEQAKKLDKMGVVLETTWMWWDENNMEPYVQIRVPLMSKYAKFYPAPNVAELGVLLPKEVFFPCEDRGHYYKSELTCYWFDGYWYADYTKSGSTESLHTFKAETEAQARAEALIGLLENGQLKPEDLKL